MKEITTAQLRKDSSLLNHNFILKKMKQGRDKIIDKKFIVVEVNPSSDKDSAIYEAIQLLSGE